MVRSYSFPGVAVITGAGGTGIGAAVTEAFASAGCERIAITDINETSLRKTEARILSAYPDIRLVVRAGDVTDEQFDDFFMDEVVSTFGRLDYAVNCVGVLGEPLRSTETSTEIFDKINNINYRGCWLSSRAELKQMLKQDPLPSHDPRRGPQRGSIVNIASQLGIVSRARAPAYCASKAAIIGMTRADAIDYSADGIRVNCICPGVIETPMTTNSEEVRQQLQPAVEIAPMRRMGQPEEVADTVLFLCSSFASFIQGHALVVDGGYVIN
ncbi:SDR family NAD(P)-dependent oxidoreductase [Aspergillus clavatus NRRL 1]|uniref:Oxidoreductase, short-chain dehydrogenase/reductase family n=1 Tax=Aspergillus clavatus (strain ATCC 1007 / CBS 513.65 / DSM 816 / NCTC 3887 / NRRL 1 / QM 1276 / 107) TaxID=344612 RepID=A1CAE7_ASPCL|nr:oxidoreductase, short-chain dehydrogenase/reductase family [Aspergillus clavatus NRRL 1]EAW12715.1 oxidoreductase, short-chain dehydrogenase/reductase family [Aspergillus clavatus NRRL 1]